MIYYEKDYYAVPDTGAEKAYELLRQALLAQKKAVSYTHLDVYKRQGIYSCSLLWCIGIGIITTIGTNVLFRPNSTMGSVDLQSSDFPCN